MAGSATHALDQLVAGSHFYRINVELIDRCYAFREATRQAALSRYGHQCQVVGDLLQIRFRHARLRTARGASDRAVHAGTVRVHRRGHCHVQHQRFSCLMAQGRLAGFPAETAQADGARLGIEHIVRLAFDAVGVRRVACTGDDVRFRYRFEQTGTYHRLGRAQRIDLWYRAFEGQHRFAQFDLGAVSQADVTRVEAADADGGAPVLRCAGRRYGIHLDRGAILRMRHLLAIRTRHGDAHAHGVETLVDRVWRRAAAIVDVTGDTDRLREARALLADSRLVAVVAILVMVTGGEVGVHQTAAFNKALHVLHADIVVRLLEHEQGIVRVVIGHRAQAARQGFLWQRYRVQTRLHAIPWAQAGADHIAPLVGVVADAAIVANRAHRLGGGKHRWRHFDDVAGHQVARLDVLAIREAVRVEAAVAWIFLDQQGTSAIDAVRRAQLVVGRVGNRFADRYVAVHQFAWRHPAVAGHAWAVEAAEEGDAAVQEVDGGVLVDDQGRLGHAGNTAVVDDFDAPGTVLEVLRHEGQVIARAFVDRQAGDRVHRFVRAVADLVPLFTALAAMAGQAARAEAGDQRAIGQGELQGFQWFGSGWQRLQSGAIERIFQCRSGAGRQAVIAAWRFESHFQQGIAVLRRARHALQADVARVDAQVIEFLGTALAVGHITYLRPGLAVIGYLQRVLLAVGGLPLQLHVADLRLGAKVELDPGAIFKCAAPAGVEFAVDCHGG